MEEKEIDQLDGGVSYQTGESGGYILRWGPGWITYLFYF
jgi:hypothetical protein